MREKRQSGKREIGVHVTEKAEPRVSRKGGGYQERQEMESGLKEAKL